MTINVGPIRDETAKNFYFDVANGDFPGMTSVLILGYTNGLSETETTTVWDVGVLYEHLDSAGETLYISSSSVSDTDVDITVVGVDENWDPVIGTANLNGQNQVEIVNLIGGTPVTFLVVNAAVVAATANTPVGDVYIAVSTTLSSGVPVVLTDAKAKIPLSGLAGDIGTRFASQNISHNAIYGVPAGNRLAILDISGRTKKDESAFMAGTFSTDGGPFFQRNPLPVYQDGFDAPFDVPVIVQEKTLIEFVGYTEPGNAGAFATIAAKCILIDNEIVPTTLAFAGCMEMT